jgi:membrane protein YqaA with SNARE-associated domain
LCAASKYYRWQRVLPATAVAEVLHDLMGDRLRSDLDVRVVAERGGIAADVSIRGSEREVEVTGDAFRLAIERRLGWDTIPSNRFTIERIREHRGVLIHLDAVQAAPYLELDVQAMDADLISFSAHKFEGPKGIGALWIRHGTALLPQVQGGAQERYRRAGTEDVAAAVGMASAFELNRRERLETARRLRRMRDRLKETLVALGPLGAFAIALVDSFVPLPGGADLAVIVLSVKSPQLAVVTVLAASLGSVIGATVLYMGARKAGAAALSRVSPARRERVENLLGKYDVAAIAITSMLPPPFPFKVFNLTAGVLKIQVVRFMLAIGAGRLARFSLEAALAFTYGEAAIDVIKRNGPLVVLIVVLAGILFLVVRVRSARKAAPVEK